VLNREEEEWWSLEEWGKGRSLEDGGKGGISEGLGKGRLLERDELEGRVLGEELIGKC